jgi:hypothetical protein
MSVGAHSLRTFGVEASPDLKGADALEGTMLLKLVEDGMRGWLVDPS